MPDIFSSSASSTASPESRKLMPVQAPRRILIRGVNWLGDAVMTTPALQRLRQRFPESQITLLTQEKLAPLWQGHSAIDIVLTFSPGQGPLSLAGLLRPEHFDLALVLPNSPRSALEVWWAGIPQRIGYAAPWRSWLLTAAVVRRPGQRPTTRRSTSEIRRLIRAAENDHPGFSLAVQRSGRSSSDAHQLYDYLHLVGALGGDTTPMAPSLSVEPEEVKAAQQEWLATSAQATPGGAEPVFIGVNPGAAYGPAKRWPAANFSAAIQAVSRVRSNCVWVSFGDSGAWELCEQVGRELKAGFVNVAGKTSLRELMVLLKSCRLLLTNDSGPMHVAAALGIPVVVPFGSTSPELTGPGLPGEARHHLLRAGVPCSPCFRRSCPIDFRCMTGIPVERVVKAVLETLGPG